MLSNKPTISSRTIYHQNRAIRQKDRSSSGGVGSEDFGCKLYHGLSLCNILMPASPTPPPPKAVYWLWIFFSSSFILCWRWLIPPSFPPENQANPLKFSDPKAIKWLVPEKFTNLFRSHWCQVIDSCPWIDFRRKMVYDCPVRRMQGKSSVYIHCEAAMN